MSRPFVVDGVVDGVMLRSGADGQADPVKEMLRDAALLLGVIGASLVLILLLSLLLPSERLPLRARSAAEPAVPLQQNQVVASAERKLPAWRAAAQE